MNGQTTTDADSATVIVGEQVPVGSSSKGLGYLLVVVVGALVVVVAAVIVLWRRRVSAGSTSRHANERQSVEHRVLVNSHDTDIDLEDIEAAVPSASETDLDNDRDRATGSDNDDENEDEDVNLVERVVRA